MIHVFSFCILENIWGIQGLHLMMFYSYFMIFQEYLFSFFHSEGILFGMGNPLLDILAECDADFLKK